MEGWKSQLKNRITTLDELKEYIDLTDEKRQEIDAASRRFKWSITPYYANLMDPVDESCPIRMQALPSAEELDDDIGVPDPLDEGKHSPVDLIIRVYPDRLAFCVGSKCPVYCRHCLRKETMVGRDDVNFSDKRIEEGVDYIRNTPQIRDVLLTGGDPLLMSDERLEEILSEIHTIPHVEVIRIGSRSPCTLPQRITPQLCKMLQNYHTIYLNTQFNHPKEITPDAEEACARLADAGIPLGNQSVLLRGINDDAETMKTLCRELMRIRVRPYYIYQCQILSGTRHFRTPIERGTEIIRKLQGYTSGLAVPRFVVDTPYGKIPVPPQYAKGREGDKFVLESWNGKIWKEPNPLSQAKSKMPVSQSPAVTCNECAVCCPETGCR